jgi:hypothetical protein
MSTRLIDRSQKLSCFCEEAFLQILRHLLKSHPTAERRQRLALHELTRINTNAGNKFSGDFAVFPAKQFSDSCQFVQFV